MNLKKIHYLSGIVITLFVGIHLFNHGAALGGAEMHLSMMKSLRKFYRNPLGEATLMLAVLAQVMTGLRLFFKKVNTRPRGFELLQIWSGMYLAVFIIIHVGAVAMGRYALHLDTNYYFGAAGINIAPFSLLFIPYYSLAVISFFGHIAAVHFLKVKADHLGMKPKAQSQAILALGIAVAFLMIFSLTDQFKGVTIPKTYHVLVGK